MLSSSFDVRWNCAFNIQILNVRLRFGFWKHDACHPSCTVRGTRSNEVDSMRWNSTKENKYKFQQFLVIVSRLMNIQLHHGKCYDVLFVCSRNVVCSWWCSVEMVLVNWRPFIPKTFEDCDVWSRRNGDFQGSENLRNYFQYMVSIGEVKDVVVQFLLNQSASPFKITSISWCRAKTQTFGFRTHVAVFQTLQNNVFLRLSCAICNPMNSKQLFYSSRRWPKLAKKWSNIREILKIINNVFYELIIHKKNIIYYFYIHDYNYKSDLR